jgi:hypothetical protein
MTYSHSIKRGLGGISTNLVKNNDAFINKNTILIEILETNLVKNHLKLVLMGLGVCCEFKQ